MIVKLLTEHHLEFLSLKGGCTGSSESTLVKMSNCWKSHAEAHILYKTLKHLFIYARQNLGIINRLLTKSRTKRCSIRSLNTVDIIKSDSLWINNNGAMFICFSRRILPISLTI